MSVLHSLKEVLHRRRVRRATLPWDELEAEAARQRCSPADIFFDRAGDCDPGDAGEPDGGPPAPATDAGESEAEERRVPWRGLDPRPAPSPAESHR
jgi:hypothetical protein